MSAYLAEYSAAVAHQRECDPRGVSDGRPWVSCMGDPCRGRARENGFTGLRGVYAWAIPTGEALDAIAQASPAGVVEIGAGSGYWAMLLRERGVDVIAYDLDPDGVAGWHAGAWSRVHFGNALDVRQHAERTLLLCWPNGGWSSRAVDLYAGSTVIYVGQAYDRPAQLHDPVRVVDIPQWQGCTDQLEVYARGGV